MRITGMVVAVAAIVVGVSLLERGVDAQPATRPARTGGGGAASQPRVSPQVAADGRVTFRVVAPSASTVVLTGEFMKGATPLVKDDAGVWAVTVGPIEPEIYYYNMTIDGVKTIDTLNHRIKTGSNPSTVSSILQVHGATPAFYDPQDVPHGEVHVLYYNSKTVKGIRRVVVYTPPGFDAAAQPGLPVLYLLHGANADETAWHQLGHANDIMDNLLAAGNTKPMIVVMPFGYTPTAERPGLNNELFGQDLLEVLIPFIQTRYHTATDSDHRGLVGLSMGGGQAMSVGLNHLELFGYVGGFSAGLSRDVPKSYGAVADPANNQHLRLLWLGCGKDDQGHMTGTKALSDFLTKSGVKHTFVETEGAHTWIVWRRYLNELAPQLFR